MGKLASYKAKAPEFQKLPEGDHIVRLASYRETDSFHNFDGSEKDDLPDFINATEQLIITCVSTEGKGAITHRMNLNGWLKFDNLNEKELKSGKYVDINSYACVKTKAGLMRVTDDDKEAICDGMVDQMYAAMGVPVGGGLSDLDNVITDKNEFSIRVSREEYEGKDQFRIASFRKVGAQVKTRSTSDLEA